MIIENDELERMWKKSSWPILRYYPSTRWRDWKTMKYLGTTYLQAETRPGIYRLWSITLPCLLTYTEANINYKCTNSMVQSLC